MNPAVSDRILVEDKANTFVAKTFGWMFAALIFTAVVSMYVLNNPAIMSALVTTNEEGQIQGSGMLFFLLFAELLVCLGLIVTVRSMPASVGTSIFFLYAGMNGVTLAPIISVYTAVSATVVFGVTALTFGIFAVIGLTTKTDLTKFGSLFFFALIGLIISMVVNMILGSETMDMVISGVAVIIFTGLIAYDAQRIKEMAGDDGAAILGALTLYLDFLNLFLHLLRIMGNKK